MTSSIDVVCIGKASYDLSLQISATQGNTEKLVASDRELCPGGPALNAAVAIQRLGATSAFVGKVGADYFGDEIIKTLNQEGVVTTHLWRGNVPTSISLIYSEVNGKRQLANHTFPSTHKPAVTAESILSLNPKILLFDGHEPELTLEVLSAPEAKNAVTIYDAGSYRQNSRAILSKVQFAIVSEPFAEEFIGDCDPKKCLAELGKIVPTVIITLGEQGLVWQKGKEQGKLSAFQVAFKDSTGAGDAFHGAFAVSILEHMEWNDSLRFASGAGALTCTKLGGFTSLPTRSSLNQFLSTNSL